jgi:tetratricopeptide (TPR) repeat protein
MNTLMLVLLLAAEPESEGSARAKELARVAQKHFKEGKFRDAANEFEQALTLRPRPALHFNLARCLEELGETGPALREFREYLRLAPTATDRAVVQERVVALEGQLGAKGLRQLFVLIEPSSAIVSIDGKERGSSPLYVEVVPGLHTISSSADGFERTERTVQLESLRSAEVRFNLKAVDAPVVTQTRAPSLTPAGPPPPEPPLLVATTPAPPRKRVFTWVAGGAAVAGAGIATGLGIAATNTSTELRTQPHFRAQGDVLVAQSRDLATGANIAWAAAGTALVTAVVLFFVEGAP